MGLRESYNNFLDKNEPLAELDRANQAVRAARRGHVPGLLAVIVAGSVCSMALSLLASILGYGNAGAALVWSLAASVAGMFVGNLVFVVFLERVREGHLTVEGVKRYAKTLPVQIVCMIVLAVGNTFASNLVGVATSFNAHVNVFCSIFVSVLFTLVNAAVAFAIYDGVKGIGNILSGAFKLLGRNWAAMLGLSILFVAWTVVANIAYARLLSGNLAEVQTINNIFHALLAAQDYPLLGQVALFYLVNYVVGGLFEIAPFLGLAWCYDRER